MASRPYLCWIFNEPDDNISAHSFFSDYKDTNDHHDNKISIKFINKVDDNSVFDINQMNTLVGEKCFPVRLNEKTGTVELRVFDMARNEEELRAIVKFVQSYYKYILNKHRVSLFQYKTPETLHEVIRDFTDLINELGLYIKDYEVFIKRNLKVRWRFGKEYLN